MQPLIFLGSITIKIGMSFNYFRHLESIFRKKKKLQHSICISYVQLSNDANLPLVTLKVKQLSEIQGDFNINFCLSISV